MKVVTASTPDQQEYVKELIERLYDEIFPCFFSKEYIEQLKEFKLMEIPQLHHFSLTEMMEVTAATQTILTILEEFAKTLQTMEEYEAAFSNCSSTLAKYEIDFPFELSDFKKNRNSTYFTNESSLYI